MVQLWRLGSGPPQVVTVIKQHHVRRLSSYATKDDTSLSWVRFAMSVQYHGASFLGFVKQPHHKNQLEEHGADMRGIYSVETHLTQALKRLLSNKRRRNLVPEEEWIGNEPAQDGSGSELVDEEALQNGFSNFRVSSRTDRGVHALHNTIHVDILQRNSSRIWTPEVLLKGLNYHLKGQRTRDPTRDPKAEDKETDKEQENTSKKQSKRFVRDPVSNHLRILNVQQAPLFFSCHTTGIPQRQPWHVQYSSTERTYVYRVRTLPGDRNHVDYPWERDRSWYVSCGQATNPPAAALDLAQMRVAASHLVGTHDFSTFRNAGCQRKSPIVTLHDIQIHEEAAFSLCGYGESSSVGNGSDSQVQLLTIVVRGNSFLYRQVRNIVGCLVEVGQGRLGAHLIPELLQARERSALQAQSAPPQGLFLARVRHGDFEI